MTILDDYEKELEESFEKGGFKRVGDFENEMQIAKEAASAFMNKTERISLRLTPYDLRQIKNIALEDGLPYQTLVSSILHKFVTGKLVERNKRT